MFGDLFGNVQKQQEELQKQLAEIMVEAEAGDGAVTVQASGDMHIENIKIDATKADVTDLEQLEDLILVAVNRALDKAKEKASEESAKLMQNILPMGMGDLDQFMKGLK